MQNADISHQGSPDRLTVVTGGARSGKSRFAEGLVRAMARPKVYIATAEGRDDEMRARIAAHRADRAAGGWQTIEAPLDLAGALSDVAPGSAVLLDCATLWLTNILLAGRDLSAETGHLLDALKQSPAEVVIVTNEVGWSIVPENALARQFRDEQGRLNQRLAAQAGRVAVVVAGLPLWLKDPETGTGTGTA
ncbi:bifunctional adenosylcobinamide kinase/adenosylcobinamide-phosphate guanylyltransferase [Szabonella alba]|uniref:Bifunctional adenosylcobalamin biosynthesis protein n=1 Tax=Szabonella alba TaxID=2804194 RepID=A0A8K0VB48_9RHOB|nr:bifunctional adenosylcobinamide kinase/adenosylcobinamide-phosphate guanylyltransferase [Szabonella alba]MBL4916017.1 bifunctional adenosylcobinamide kinase/adenosylcobinamide-phosphate guanylyltransferase [Szabonella alba]